MTNNGEALIRQNSNAAATSAGQQDLAEFLDIGRDSNSVENEHNHGEADDVHEFGQLNNNDGSLPNNNGVLAAFLEANDLDIEPFIDLEANNNLAVDGGEAGHGNEDDEIGFDEFMPSPVESDGSHRFASQGSDFFAAASPSYSSSLPCLSQSSQDSCSSSGIRADILMTMENQCIFPDPGESGELNLRIVDIRDSGSQPEAKRMRLDDS